jgi:hypothetical protein
MVETLIASLETCQVWIPDYRHRRLDQQYISTSMSRKRMLRDRQSAGNFCIWFRCSSNGIKWSY